MQLFRHRIWLIMLAAGIALVAQNARACITPVFRYALERWEPSTYSLLVYHRGPLSTNDEAILKGLRQASTEDQGVLNLAITTVDLAEKIDPPYDQIWQQQSNAPLPWLVLRYPQTELDAPSAWAGPLNQKSAQSLGDSPLRHEIAKRIAAGNAAVWVLLECGDKAQNDEAAALLSTELKKAAQTLDLPADPALDQTNTTQLKVEFSLLRVKHNDPSERFFVQMLLAVDKDLAEQKTPIAVPVFGRGRALCALPGPQITVATLKETLSFLTGSCSCEVKELNPGLDLLMTASWSEMVEGNRLSDPPAPVLTGLGEALDKPKARATNAAPVVAQVQPADASGKLYRNIIYACLGLVTAVGLMTLVLSRARK